MLEQQGITVTTTSPNTSQQNAFEERRFLTIFNATRAALAHSGLPLTYWSVAALDVIDKMNYLPVQRKTGTKQPPNSTLYPNLIPKGLLSFGQRGYIVDTTPKKKKLAPRAIPARYLRALTHAQYLVFLPHENKTRLIRPAEFIITSPESPFAPPHAAPHAFPRVAHKSANASPQTSPQASPSTPCVRKHVPTHISTKITTHARQRSRHCKPARSGCRQRP